MRRSYQPSISSPPPLPAHIQEDLTRAPPYDYRRDSPVVQHIDTSRYSIDQANSGRTSASTLSPPAVGAFRQSRQSMSDVALTGDMVTSDDYNARGRYRAVKPEEEDDLTLAEPFRKRPSSGRYWFDRLCCCGCLTCCPRWARYCSCLFLVVIIGVGIAVGVLAALFKMPQVSMSGMENQPTVNVTNGGYQIDLGFQLQISVDNPNVEGITFDTLVAKAYYPNHNDVQLGGGEKNQVHIMKEGVTNFTFPFSLSIQMGNTQYQTILDDIFNRCGLYGAPKQQILVNYNVIPTVKIGLIPISITIGKSASFDCPDILANGGILSGASQSIHL
ncbi:hypothetical protein DM01DRAFT_1335934 [Hesseltinella vesiculosa]|uniref:Late embryogenesis abundant protein LEA-2 subgroup domain-containing protein n=1 Tax=Hesseltinella vesiculosa TaxID=101127 RepID=A0A1X2GHX3_9FUNG|nr:hypothetical protein DM01DRAFT_1335934 [Hesseltinella vesiculosa]